MSESFPPVKVPKGLFSRIIKRLGLERQLRVVKNNLGIFSTLSAVFLFLCFFAFIGLRDVLRQSSFGPFISLIFSDPGVALKYWHSLIYSIFESMPGMEISLFLIILSLLMLFVRAVISYFEKLAIITETIRKDEHNK